MKIITLCGSLKFQKEMMTIAEKMALKGYCILTPVYPLLLYSSFFRLFLLLLLILSLFHLTLFVNVFFY